MITFTIRTAIPLLLAIFVGGCAAPGKKADAEPSGTIDERAAERWDLVAKQNWYAAYEYLSPGTRVAMDDTSYAQRMSAATIRWLRGEVVDTSACEEEEICEITVRVHYRVTGGVTGVRSPVDLSRLVNESWMKVDGAWYFVPDSLR